MRNERRRGLVLLEAMVALLVIGVTSVAALELFGAQARAAARVPTLVVATELARERLTTIRLSPLDHRGRLPDSLAHGIFAPPFESYRWHATLGYSSEPAVNDIEVLVEWPAGRYALGTRVSPRSDTAMRGVSR